MKILVCKINHLGDAVSFLPTLRGISEHFPEAELTVVCTEIGRQVFEGAVPRIRFFPVDYGKIRSFSAITQLLLGFCILGDRRFSYSFHSYDEPSFAYLLSMILRVPKRVGFATNIARCQNLLSVKLPWDPSRNVVDINYDLVRWLTDKWEIKPKRTPIHFSSQDFLYVEKCLRGIGLNPRSSFVVIHPGAKLQYKKWNIENYLQLANYIEEALTVPCLFVVEKADGTNFPFRILKDLSIKQLSCLLKMAAIFIGNNSGPMHIATSMGTPSLIIQGPSPKNWEIFWPEVPSETLKATHLECVPCEKIGSIPGSCLNKEYPNGCMKEISLQQVKHSVTQLLNNLKNHPDHSLLCNLPF